MCMDIYGDICTDTSTDQRIGCSGMRMNRWTRHMGTDIGMDFDVDTGIDMCIYNHVYV